MKKTEEKRLNDHSVALKGSTLFTQANFALVLSSVLFIILLLSSIRYSDGSINPKVMALALTNGLFTLIQWFITRKVKKDILQKGFVQPKTRRFGYIQLLSIVAGNVFVVVYAFQLIKKEVTAEYIFTCYMLLTQIFMIGLSALNIFKPYVADLFPISMLVMFILTGVQINFLST